MLLLQPKIDFLGDLYKFEQLILVYFAPFVFEHNLAHKCESNNLVACRQKQQCRHKIHTLRVPDLLIVLSVGDENVENGVEPGLDRCCG